MHVLDRVKYLIDNAEELNVTVVEKENVVIIDAGVNTRPGYLVGALLVEIATGGLAHAQISTTEIEGKPIPVLNIVVDNPVLACMCYQIAGWIIQRGSETLYISGPGKVIAGKPRKIIEQFCHENCNKAPVFLVETDSAPSRETLQELIDRCKNYDRIYIILTSPLSIAGQVQICGRVIEVALFSLFSRGIEIARSATSAIGKVVLPPSNFARDSIHAIAICNDLILLTGDVTLTINTEKIEIPNDVVYREDSRTFSEVLQEYGKEFLTKIDPKMFKVARLTLYFKDGALQLGKLRIDKVRTLF